ncbi:hypothetical protein N7470_000901 [Penicillium chermesinum]|nr:hypothetical protein N7470_000901 [Penicillium chermesinum]
MYTKNCLALLVTSVLFLQDYAVSADVIAAGENFRTVDKYAHRKDRSSPAGLSSVLAARNIPCSQSGGGGDCDPASGSGSSLGGSGAGSSTALSPASSCAVTIGPVVLAPAPSTASLNPVASALCAACPPINCAGSSSSSSSSSSHAQHNS